MTHFSAFPLKKVCILKPLTWGNPEGDDVAIVGPAGYREFYPGSGEVWVSLLGIDGHVGPERSPPLKCLKKGIIFLIKFGSWIVIY